MASNDQQTSTPEAEAAPSAASPAEGTGESLTGSGDASKGSSRSPAKKAAADDADARVVRRVRLTLSSVDPFSVMKLSFLIAIAIGIATVVAIILLWNIVNAMGIWASIDSLGRDLTGGEPLPFMEFFTFSKFVSYGTVIAAVNVVIITALGTLLAFLYNIVAALLGGLTMTFTDD